MKGLCCCLVWWMQLCDDKSIHMRVDQVAKEGRKEGRIFFCGWKCFQINPIPILILFSPPCAGSRCVSLHQNLFRKKPFVVMVGCLNLQTKDWKSFFFFWGVSKLCQKIVWNFCGGKKSFIWIFKTHSLWMKNITGVWVNVTRVFERRIVYCLCK